MQIRCTPLTLHLRTPFRIAHGVSTSRTNALVEIVDGDGRVQGRGEAGLPPYLDIDFHAVETWLSQIELPSWAPSEPPPIRSWLATLPEGPLPARCALDLALHDLWATRIDQPLYRLLGVDPDLAPAAFGTLSIPENPELLTAKELPLGNRIKLKLGSGDVDHDLAIVSRVRDLSDGVLCVDVNGAWSIPEAVRAIPRLAEMDVAFIEQPIAAGDADDWHLLRRLLGSGTPVPLIADESARTVDDWIALAGAADGVNIKLAKCGGIAAALRLMDLARDLDLSVMLGCMVESSLAITAAAHLTPLADYIDLDGADLLSDDPFRGVQFVDGRPVLPQRAGLGVEPR